jgi:hypothetical protein
LVFCVDCCSAANEGIVARSTRKVVGFRTSSERTNLLLKNITNNNDLSNASRFVIDLPTLYLQKNLPQVPQKCNSDNEFAPKISRNLVKAGATFEPD